MDGYTASPPQSWALCWAKSEREIGKRTPARRCEGEFDRLFSLRFRERFGDGMRIKPNKTPVRIDYSPASRGVPAMREELRIGGETVPDIRILERPRTQLGELVQACTDEPAPYSRWIGRSPEDTDALQGLALLPATLLPEHQSPGLDALRKRIEEVLSEALQSRLAENSLARDGLEDMSGPVIRLANLAPEDLFILLTKLRDVVALGDPERYVLPDEALRAFLVHCSERIGDAYFRTRRNTIKAFVDLLTILEQNPSTAWEDPSAASLAPIAEHLLATLRGSSNLIFANQRRSVEELAHRLRERCERTISAYGTGARPVPRYIALACKGWEAERRTS